MECEYQCGEEVASRCQTLLRRESKDSEEEEREKKKREREGVQDYLEATKTAATAQANC